MLTTKPIAGPLLLFVVAAVLFITVLVQPTFAGRPVTGLNIVEQASPSVTAVPCSVIPCESDVIGGPDVETDGALDSIPHCDLWVGELPDGGVPSSDACISGPGMDTAPFEAALAAVVEYDPRFAGIRLRDETMIGGSRWAEVTALDSSPAFFVTITVGWGDCEAGCIDRHTWEFLVRENGAVQPVSESGPAVPAEITGYDGTYDPDVPPLFPPAPDDGVITGPSIVEVTVPMTEVIVPPTGVTTSVPVEIGPVIDIGSVSPLAGLAVGSVNATFGGPADGRCAAWGVTSTMLATQIGCEPVSSESDVIALLMLIAILLLLMTGFVAGVVAGVCIGRLS